MAYKIVVQIKGEALNARTTVLDENKSEGVQAIQVVEKYEQNNWILSYDREDVSSTHKLDTIVFVDKDKREEFRAEMNAIHGGDPTKISSLDTVEIIEEGEV